MKMLLTSLAIFSLVVVAAAQSKRGPGVKYTNPPALSVPTGYTHVVEATGGRTIYISGQVAFDRAGNLVGRGDFKTQTRQVFDNLKAALAGVGATFDHVVKTNMYVTSVSDLQALREIRSNYYGKNAPAGTLVRVVELARPELMIEIEAIAVVPE